MLLAVSEQGKLTCQKPARQQGLVLYSREFIFKSSPP